MSSCEEKDRLYHCRACVEWCALKVAELRSLELAASRKASSPARQGCEIGDSVCGAIRDKHAAPASQVPAGPTQNRVGAQITFLFGKGEAVVYISFVPRAHRSFTSGDERRPCDCIPQQASCLLPNCTLFPYLTKTLDPLLRHRTSSLCCLLPSPINSPYIVHHHGFTRPIRNPQRGARSREDAAAQPSATLLNR
jgi:hypothetical protein